MAVMVEGKNSFFLADRAMILGAEKRDMAWAEKYVKSTNKSLAYVLGRYAESDKANQNRQMWTLDGLRLGQPTIQHAPLNMIHDPRSVVGSFIATEMMYPVDADGAQENKDAAYEYQTPYIEALGVFWKYYFPQEYAMVEMAHASGNLFFSMEAISETLTCAGDKGCQKVFPYDGPRSETYCACLNDGPGFKQMDKPHFLAGALIIPPAKPGWIGAGIKELSALVNEHQREAELAYDGFKEASPHLKEIELESLTHQVLALAKRFPKETSNV